MKEMERYLCAVFKVLFKAAPDEVGDIDESPEELARTTALQCFEDVKSMRGIIDGEDEPFMSIDDFKAWYAAGEGNYDDEVNVQKIVATAPRLISIEQTRRLLGVVAVCPTLFLLLLLSLLLRLLLLPKPP
mgnify:CR=1 FL=1